MRKTITIGTKNIELVANAASPYLYKQVFHEDYLLQSRKLAEEEDSAVVDSTAADMFVKLGYIMANQASAKDMTRLNYDGFLNWLSQFEPNDVLEAVNEIADVWRGQEAATSVPKNSGV